MTVQKQSMKAVLVPEPGAAENMVYTDTHMPVVGEDEVLIRVMAAGVNHPDIFQREGKYPPPPGASDILGLEVAGIIEETGEKVCALLGGGGYAEYVAAPRTQCLPIPKGLSFEEAAALPECVFTVWKNIFIHGAFKAGETVLIHGGTSGIGSFAIQMVRAFGGRAVVTCGTDEKCAAAEKMGADLAINYKDKDFAEEVLSFTDHHGVDVVLDMVGGDYVRRNLSCMAQDGRHVSIAFLNGAKSEIIIPEIMKKHLALTGSMLRQRPRSEKAALAKEIHEKVWPKIESGNIKPQIYKTFPLSQAAAAHQLMEDGHHIGKIVLTV